MSLLMASGLRLAFGGQDVLHDVDLTVGSLTRIGLVGPNGAGKSTLLRLLAGELQPDAGHVVRTGTLGYLPQEPSRARGESILAHLARRTGVTAAEVALDAAADALAGATETAFAAHEEALERWIALGGEDFASRASEVLADLGLPSPASAPDIAGLSGGQMARVSLAAILLTRADVLLLDEPTNDLDLDGLERLEQFVAGLRGGLVVVSHDREFLSRSISEVLELDPVNRSWSRYAGGWEIYQEERARARRLMRERYEAASAARASVARQVQSAKEQSVRGALRARTRAPDGDKVARAGRIEAATKGAQKVRGLESRLAQVDRRMEREGVVEPRKEWQLRLDLPAAPRSGDVVAVLRDAVVHRGAFTLGPMTLDLAEGDRVRIVGPNGGGKSTLLSVLLGHTAPDEGTSTLGAGVVVGELDQARVALQRESTVVDLLVTSCGLEPTEARTLLAKFGLAGEQTTRPSRALSPGERTRAVLAVLMGGGTNLLVLDEPTNHLDLPAIEQLEAALEDYAGTLLLVSHDRRLLDAVATTRTWTVADGMVRER